MCLLFRQNFTVYIYTGWVSVLRKAKCGLLWPLWRNVIHSVTSYCKLLYFKTWPGSRILVPVVAGIDKSRVDIQTAGFIASDYTSRTSNKRLYTNQSFLSWIPQAPADTNVYTSSLESYKPVSYCLTQRKNMYHYISYNNTLHFIYICSRFFLPSAHKQKWQTVRARGDFVLSNKIRIHS